MRFFFFVLNVQPLSGWHTPEVPPHQGKLFRIGTDDQIEKRFEKILMLNRWTLVILSATKPEMIELFKWKDCPQCQNSMRTFFEKNRRPKGGEIFLSFWATFHSWTWYQNIKISRIFASERTFSRRKLYGRIFFNCGPPYWKLIQESKHKITKLTEDCRKRSFKEAGLPDRHGLEQ